MMDITREPITHELKIWPPFFESVVSGRKPFEVRKDDRLFQVGDKLKLCEWSEDTGYTGMCVEKEITFILYGGAFGIEDGYVVMGLI